MKNLPTIGFLGTGMIANAMITGFCERAADTPYPIIVSNRSVEKAKVLSEKYPERVSLAESFQECVDKSDWVVIAVLPQAAEEVLSSLVFKPKHKIVTVIFSKPAEDIAPLLNCKVDTIVHMVPGTFVSVVSGPIIMRPGHPEAEEIFGHIGKMIPVEDKNSQQTIVSLTGMFAPIFSVMDEMIMWCKSKGVDESVAKNYVTSLFIALSEETTDTDASGIHKLATVNTPGGINMQAVEQITKAGGFGAFSDALDSILKRIQG